MLENDQMYLAKGNKPSPIDDYEIPKMLPRLASALVDLSLYILLSFILLTISGLIIGKVYQPFIASNDLISDHIGYSKLAKYDEKNGYVSYSQQDYYSYENNNSLIINQVAYFYLSYLTGENVDSSLKASLDKDEQIKIDGISYLPKEYYNVTFFNEKILKVEEEDNTFFKYQEEDGLIDKNKIAIVNEEYLEEIVVDDVTTIRLANNSNLLAFIDEIYQNAIKVFYKQKSIVSASKIINNTNMAIMLISSIPAFLIFYILIPLLSPFGKTLGKYLLSLAVVDDKGYQVKKWRLLIRSLPILGVTIYICLINSLYYQLIVTLLLLLISLGILVFTPKRKALHDLMAGTVVIRANKQIIIYPNAEKYQEALTIIEKKKEANHG